MHQQKVAEYELYKRIKLLGQGSYGKAYLVECLSDHQLCVIKQMDMNNMSEDEKKETIKEARILEALKHPNIVKFREVYKTQKGKLCIVMEYAEGGDLAQVIKEQKNGFMRENLILDWFTQMSLAIKHCHGIQQYLIFLDRKIIHRDLKAQNIFINKDQTILLGDFGIAKVLNHTRQKCKTMVGTPYYLSPEIINSQMYSFKTDIWSLGIVLYEMCALTPPFDAQSIHHLAMKIVQGKYQQIPSIYSKELRLLIAQLLQIDPAKRPNIHEVLKTPIIQNRIKKFLSETIRHNEFSHTIIHKKNFVSENDNIGFPTKPVQPPPQQNIQIVQQQQSKVEDHYKNPLVQPLNALFSPQCAKPNYFFNQNQNQNGKANKLMHNPSTPQLQNNPRNLISKLEQQQNKFADNNRVFQPINYPSNQIDKKPQQYLPNRYQEPQKKPLYQQIEEKKQELKKFEEFKYERNQKNEQLYNKIVDNYLKDDKKSAREEERRKMKKDIQDRRTKISQDEVPVEIRLKQNHSRHSNNSTNDSKDKDNYISRSELEQQSPLPIQPRLESDQKNKFLKKSEPKNEQQFLFSDEKEPKMLNRQQSEVILVADTERRGADVSHMPNNQEYLDQVYGDLENLLEPQSEHIIGVIPEETTQDQDKENDTSISVNQEKSPLKKEFEQNILLELDKSKAEVLKKYEQNDTDREDDDEDLYQEYDQIQEETQKMSLLKVLQKELGKENALDMINNVKSKIKQTGLERFAIEGFEEVKGNMLEDDRQLFDKYIGMIVLYAIMNE